MTGDELRGSVGMTSCQCSIAIVCLYLASASPVSSLILTQPGDYLILCKIPGGMHATGNNAPRRHLDVGIKTGFIVMSKKANE